MAEIDLSTYNKRKKPSSKASEQSENGRLKKLLNTEIRLGSKQMNDKVKERFYSEFDVLLTAGVDVKTALELIEHEQGKEKEKKVFKKIREEIIQGKSLSEAIRDSGRFSPYEYYSLQIGEESGKLNDVLRELSYFFSRKIKQKRQVTSALSYPVIVLFTAIGAIFFMLHFIVPMFSDVFKRFDTDLPALTQTVISLSQFIGAYAYLFFLVLFGLILLVLLQRNTLWFKRVSSWILLRIPLFGTMIRKVYLARFCHSMNLLTASKTPMIRAIQLVKKMVGFYPITVSLSKIEEDILKGKALYQSMESHKIYNRRMVSLIKVAEEVNQLDTMFGNLAKQYTDEIEHQTGLIGSVIEPIMIIFLGVMVAIILVAMYLPLFQLSTSFM